VSSPFQPPVGLPGRRASAQGFTLIEVLVALAIAALLGGMAIKGMRGLAKTDLRGASAQMSGAIRYLFDRASTTGKHHRMVIDLANGKYWAEVSDDKFYVPHEAETEREVRQREDKEAEQDEELRRRREERLRAERDGKGLPATSSFDYSKMEVGDFQPKRPRFAAFKELALKPVKLKSKVVVSSVYTPRVVDPITEGRAYIYFFPLGQTEPAIVTLSDPKGTTFYSLVVHPITGRVKIHNQQIQPPIDRFDDNGNRVVQ
jgi:general secretion pathway protein H